MLSSPFFRPSDNSVWGWSVHTAPADVLSHNYKQSSLDKREGCFLFFPFFFFYCVFDGLSPNSPNWCVLLNSVESYLEPSVSSCFDLSESSESESCWGRTRPDRSCPVSSEDVWGGLCQTWPRPAANTHRSKSQDLWSFAQQICCRHICLTIKFFLCFHITNTSISREKTKKRVFINNAKIYKSTAQ